MLHNSGVTRNHTKLLLILNVRVILTRKNDSCENKISLKSYIYQIYIDIFGEREHDMMLFEAKHWVY